MKILIAPLDWGLGHTTRCIPLIQYLSSQGHEVYAAAEAGAAKLLRANFQELNIIPLKGYGIQYSKSKATFSLRILQQIPKILKAIRAEHRWLQHLQQHTHFDLVISDNRYGLYHHGVACVIITHQLQIQSGVAYWLDSLIRRLHYGRLRKFDACWVADEEEGYSGRLAHPRLLPPQASYIGILSQFANTVTGKGQTIPNRLLVLLSGPEPMRSILEQQLLLQAAGLTAYRFVIVGGNPMGRQQVALPEHIVYHTHLNATQLKAELEAAALVICRSGYSTIMDLALLQKKALLIPTPGQSEQEYLARYLTSVKGAFHTVSQQQLNLQRDVAVALAKNRLPLPHHSFLSYMEKVVAPFIARVQHTAATR